LDDHFVLDRRRFRGEKPVTEFLFGECCHIGRIPNVRPVSLAGC
jgi:hypothetical protein